MAAEAEGLVEQPRFTDEFLRDFEDLLRWRRDVRRFRTDRLPEGKLERLLQLADLAPSVGNSQPWRVVVVESPEKRDGVIASFETENEAAAEHYPDEKATRYRQLKLAGLREAPVHLAIFSDTDPDDNPAGTEMFGEGSRGKIGVIGG